MTYYQQLNISPDASAQQIKEAYRKLAFEFHPDRNAGDQSAADKMKALNEAYAVLSNPQKRRQYDALYQHYGDNASERFRQSCSEQEIFRGSDVHQIFEEMARSFGLRGFDEIFKDFYGSGYHRFEFRQPGIFGKGIFFGTPFSGLGRGAKGPGLFGALAGALLNRYIGAAIPKRGGDLHDTIIIQPELAEQGGPYAYLHRQRDKKLVVQIPARVRHGQTIRLTGMGKAGQQGAQSGDLLLRIQVRTSLMKRLKGLVGLTDSGLGK
jgi:DnaJ-class molecular chaperone